MPIVTTAKLRNTTLHNTKLYDASLRHKSVSLISLFDKDPERIKSLSFNVDNIFADFSKHHIDKESLGLLIDYADACDLKGARARLFAGDKINHTENRAVLHMALRAEKDDEFKADGESVTAAVIEMREKCFALAESVRNGKWLGATGKKIKTIVNIGIGGSDLGPQLIVDALFAQIPDNLNVKFISRLDGTHVTKILRGLDPHTSLFVIVSKTFTTLETLENAKACRDWLIDELDEDAVAKHFVAVSTNINAVTEFGIDANNIFGFWDWVGGRFSVWSAVGLSVMIAIGAENFSEFLEGARASDQHFLTAPYEQNIPVMMGLLGFWYGRFFESPAHVILSYDETLRILPSYLQQLDMESNGKSVDNNGERVQNPTGPIIFGGLGNDGQHAYYQWLHQSPNIVPTDFLAPIKPSYEFGSHHALLLSNCFAQSQALMLGKSVEQARDELVLQGLNAAQVEALVPYKVFEGNRPSTTLLYSKMSPKLLGSLLAIYEHKIFVQGVLFNINSFDQWGVELGKQLASKLIPALKQNKEIDADPSTVQLIEKFLSGRV